MGLKFEKNTWKEDEVNRKSMKSMICGSKVSIYSAPFVASPADVLSKTR